MPGRETITRRPYDPSPYGPLWAPPSIMACGILALPYDIIRLILLQTATCKEIGRLERVCKAIHSLSRGLPVSLREQLWNRLLSSRWPVEECALLRIGADARNMYRGFAVATDVTNLSCVDMWQVLRPHQWSTLAVDGMQPEPPKVVLVVGSHLAGIASWDCTYPSSSRLIGCTFASPLILGLGPCDDVREEAAELKVRCYVVHPRTLRCVRLFSGTAAEAELTADGSIITFEHGEGPEVSGEYDPRLLPWNVHLCGGLHLRPTAGVRHSYECTACVVTVGDRGEDGLSRSGLKCVLWDVLSAEDADEDCEGDDELSNLFGWI